MFRVCVKYKALCFTGLLRILKCDAASKEKCKHAVFFKGGVGNARRADRINRHFVGVGHGLSAKAEKGGPPDDPPYVPDMAHIAAR